MVKIRKNSWAGLGNELSTRLCNGLKSLTFIGYFAVGVIFIGGIGIWLPYGLSDSENKVLLESQNVLTFYFAILGTLSIECHISKNRNINLASIGLIFGAISLGLGFCGYLNTREGSSSLVNLGAFITLLIFLFSTVNDEKFDSEDDKKIADSIGYESPDIDLIKDK